MNVFNCFYKVFMLLRGESKSQQQDKKMTPFYSCDSTTRESTAFEDQTLEQGKKRTFYECVNFFLSEFMLLRGESKSQQETSIIVN
jgi:hypothetical protein